MEQLKDSMGMLDLMTQPSFCVQEHIIQKVNHAAHSLLIRTGTDVRELLRTGVVEYESFTDGCLYLTLQLSGQSIGASVMRMDGCDVFLLEEMAEQPELQALALAARGLREPLATAMLTTERLFETATEENLEKLQHLDRELHQMLRMIGNMSDAARYSAGVSFLPETVDITAFMRELFEKNIPLIASAGFTLCYTGTERPIFCSADPEKLERAVLNMLSNAIKFTPKGGKIDARLTRTGSLVRLSIHDSGEGIPEDVRSTVYTRYLRQPTVEDGRYGIGLGMVLIRSVAALHGGTVLLDLPEDGGTRISMTLALARPSEQMVRSPLYRIDYAGERDHSLIELSECLPPKLYVE